VAPWHLLTRRGEWSRFFTTIHGVIIVSITDNFISPLMW